MLDPALLRKDLDAVVRRLASRGFAFALESFNALVARRKAVQTETQTLQAQRNALAKQIGALKSRGEDASAVMAQSQALPLRLKALEQELTDIQQQLNDLLLARAILKCVAGYPYPIPYQAILNIWALRRAIMSRWARPLVWILMWQANYQALALALCAGHLRVCTARWPSSCLICKLNSMATPSAIHLTS